MAGRAELTPKKKKDEPAALPEPLHDPDEIRKHVAKLYGQGLSRPMIAKAMVKYLATNTERPLEQQLQAVRGKLRRWERDQSFRDLVWDQAVIDLDMSTPQILRGVMRSAKRGRVDAAKLALEITGRHVTKGDQTAPNIVIAFNGIPRPQRTPLQIAEATQEDIDGVVIEDED